MSENNYAIVSGIVETKPEYNYEYKAMDVYNITIGIKTQNGEVDHLLLMIPQGLLHGLKIGMHICAVGQMYSYIKSWRKGSTSQLTAIFCKYVFKSGKEDNRIILDGVIGNEPEITIIPSGEKICNVQLAVNGKSEMIPCIACGKFAKKFMQKKKGEKVMLWGRAQSNSYIKRKNTQEEDNQNSQNAEKRTTCEVLVQYVM